MYAVPRTQSHNTTEHPAGLAALNWSNRPAVQNLVNYVLGIVVILIGLVLLLAPSFRGRSV